MLGTSQLHSSASLKASLCSCDPFHSLSELEGHTWVGRLLHQIIRCPRWHAMALVQETHKDGVIVNIANLIGSTTTQETKFWEDCNEVSRWC